MSAGRKAGEHGRTPLDAWINGLRTCSGAFLAAGILSLLVVTPLSHGGSGFLAQGLINGAIYSLVALGCLRWAIFPHALRSERCRHYHGRHRGFSLLAAAGLIVGYGLLQMVPLPASLIRWLSPQAVVVREVSLGTLASGPVLRWFPLSLSPAATRGALVVLAASWGFFFLSLTNSTSWKNLRRAALLLTISGFVVSLWGIMKVGAAGWAVPGDPANPDAVPFATFINHSHFANWAGMVALLGFGYLFSLSYREEHGAGREYGGLSWPRRLSGPNLLFMRLGMGFMLAVIIGAILISASKGGVVSLLVGMVAFSLLMTAHRSFGKGWKIAVAITALITVAAVIGGGPLLARISGMARTGGWERLESGRAGLNRDLQPMIRDYAWTGGGPGTFADLYPRYQTAEPTNRYSYAHNEYLQLWAEWGIVGVALFLGLAALYLRKYFHRWTRRRNREIICLSSGAMGGLAVMLTHSAADFSLRIPANALTFMFLAAFAFQTVEVRTTPVAEGAANGYNGATCEVDKDPPPEEH